MNIKRFKLLVFTFQLFYFVVISQTTNYSKYVNPMIGTDKFGHTFPGALVPFGMLQLSPDTRVDGSWEGCAGYHFSDSIIYGFSHTHLSGTGVSDYCDVLVMPTIGNPSLDKTDYASKFSHANEKSEAGYYQVKLLDNDINAELTATPRVGIHRYTFPKTQKSTIIVDLTHRDVTIDCNLQVLDSVTLAGFRLSDSWATKQYVYFVMKFSKPILQSKLFSFNSKSVGDKSQAINHSQSGYFQFNTADEKPLIVKVGISQTDLNGALKNLEVEAPHFNFEIYKDEAKKLWENQLSKIEVKSEDTTKLETFYTALYHCMIHPSLAGDVDGRYRGRDDKIHQAKNFVPYTVFSLWDTFRALHPLFTLIEQKRTADFINSFVEQFEQSGRLPMWELSANETNCMIGFHSASVIADAVSKNIKGFDKQASYKALVSTSNYTSLGYPIFNKNYFLQLEDESESVSKTLEYAYDNWCVAKLAQKLNKKNDYNVFMKRALGYQNLFNVETSFFQPKKNGNWVSNFNPREVNNNFTEANGWQYLFFVPQDLGGLNKLMGGDKKMELKLDELFKSSSDLKGRKQVDITGLIGQYAHGNEPSHHIAYLYNYVGKPYKTQKIVNSILSDFYTNKPDGLIGNDDCGQMSAWYVMSSMGFYQACPGFPEYTITTPLFESVKIHLENKKIINIRSKNFNQNSRYIHSFSINQKKVNSVLFSHQMIARGANLEFTLQSTPDSLSELGKLISNRLPTQINDVSIITAPIINQFQKDNHQFVTISSLTENAEIYYTTNGSEPNKSSNVYHNPFISDSFNIIKAKVYFNQDSSSVTLSHLYKKINNYTIKLKSSYIEQYSAGSDEGVIDGIKGTLNWRSGEWQGYQDADFECVIDLQKETEIKSLSSSYLQDVRSWIIFPKQVEYYTSLDGINYQAFGIIANDVPESDYDVQIKSFSKLSTKDIKAKYIKVVAKKFGKLPEWHLGKGGDAIIFIDEVEIK